MSKSFKKVVACLLAVLMVMFSVPFTAFAAVDYTEYKPDVQLQFGTLFQADGDNKANWIDNYSEGSILNMKGKNATYDFALSGISGPQLKTTGTVSNDAKYTVTGLKLEAADTANVANTAVNEDYELEGLGADYDLKAGDAFTVTIRMDNVPSVYVATAEICYSGNIEPLYGIQEGSGKSATYTTGTASQLGVDGNEEDFDLGIHAVPEFDAQALYADINSDEIGSQLVTDAISGETYMYAECLGSGSDWSAVNKNTQCIDEDGNVTTMANKSVMATFAFVLKEDISASNPINFWVHNGDKKGVGSNGKYTGLAEGIYKSISDNSDDKDATTYSENRFVDADHQFDAEEENFGSRKMTFMGKNENVESAGHEHDFTGAVPAWTWADDNSSATATITCTADGCDQSAGYQISATDSEIDASEDTATCTEAGKITYSASVTLNGETVSTTKDVDTEAKGHDYQAVVTQPTCTEQGYTTYTCSRCSDSYKADYVPANGHSFAVISVDWDSLDKNTGVVAVTKKCSVCQTEEADVATAAKEVIQQQTETDPEITRFTVTVGEFTESRDIETQSAAGHTHVPGEAVEENRHEPSCTEPGSYDLVVYCTTCGEEISRETKTIDALNHDYKAVVTPPTCTEGGYTTYTCSRCHDSYTADETDPLNHDFGAWIETEPAVAPTKEEAGKTAVETHYCSRCDAYETRGGEVIEALGVDITISKHDIGVVKFNGVEVNANEDTANHSAYGAQYTLSIEEDNDTFEGWQMNGKIVSTDKTFTTYAYADVTVDPVFTEPTTDNMTVVFYDKFSNKIAEYNGPKADYADYIEANFPVAPEYPSLKFKGWKDITEDEIKSLQESKTIWAEYEAADSIPEYAVRVFDNEGADITAACLGDENTFAYDTYVTVTNESAKAWEIDGVQVATGDSYSFYVGSNVDITMITDDVTPVATTTIIGANRVAEPAYRYNILATRNVPANYELVRCGFVYGKNLVDTDMTIDNEGKVAEGDNRGAVKVAYANNTTSNEFALNYGIKTPGNTVCVRSFIVVKEKATGKVTVQYSNVEHYES